MPIATLENLQQFNDAKNTGFGLTVIDFWATWCGPCIRIAPAFAKIAEENPQVNFCKVDVDANAEAAEAAGIQAMPTFKFYKGGECVETLKGASEAKLRELVAKYK